MARYSAERKASVLKKLLPPHNRTISEVAKEEGISEPTLYNWRTKVKEQGFPVPGNEKNADQWSAQAKFAVVVESATLSQSELSEYCRKKGLLVEQIQRWKQAFIDGSLSEAERRKQEQQASKQDKRRIKQLEKELNRKDKALAETAALLVLRKKLNALWGESDSEES